MSLEPKEIDRLRRAGFGGRALTMIKDEAARVPLRLAFARRYWTGLVLAAIVALAILALSLGPFDMRLPGSQAFAAGITAASLVAAMRGWLWDWAHPVQARARDIALAAASPLEASPSLREQAEQVNAHADPREGLAALGRWPRPLKTAAERARDKASRRVHAQSILLTLGAIAAISLAAFLLTRPA